MFATGTRMTWTLDTRYFCLIIPSKDSLPNNLGSYDRTCKLFHTDSGRELHSLVGHQNVVYTVAFNNPFDSLVLTGRWAQIILDLILWILSFDKTAKIWSVKDGSCLATISGHTSEVVSVEFSPDSNFVATGSMDSTAKLWNIQGVENCVQPKLKFSFDDHCGEIISLTFDTKVYGIYLCTTI